MTVSVVIPTYKASAFIRATLASVFAQTRLPDEVIVADDCSPDDTVAVVEEIAKTAPVPVRVIRLATNSGGPARPLNVGIEAARGDLIATLDHDDTFPPNKLADQVPLFEAHPDLGLVFGRLEITGPDADGNGRFQRLLNDRLAVLPAAPAGAGGFRIAQTDAVAAAVRWQSFVGTCSNMLFPKAVWRQVGGIDERNTVSCDFGFLAGVACQADLGYHPGPSCRWAIHPSSFYRTSAERARVMDQLRVYRHLLSQPLATSVVKEVRRAIRTVAAEGAHSLRQGKDYAGAARCLLTAIRAAGPWRGGLLALAKLPPHQLLRGWPWLVRAVRRRSRLSSEGQPS